MFNRTVSEEDLRRLKADRHAADKRYNDALTAVDEAVQKLPQKLPELPHPPPSSDETQLPRLNTLWEILTARPRPAGWRGRVAAFVWGLIEPVLTGQQAFNAALVDHINRNASLQRDLPQTVGSTIALLRDELELLIRFESQLVIYLQEITPYIDTKDYEFRGLAQRIVEDVAEAVERVAEVQADLERRLRTSLAFRGLAASLSTVSDDMQKRWERYEGLRTSMASLQQSVHALRRQLENVPEVTAAGARRAATAQQVAPAARDANVSYALSSSPTESHQYLSFEDAFRGERQLIEERQRQYLPLFAHRSDVLDIGCGRGEFLRLLKENGVTARGVDVNHAMVADCQESGLDAIEADALDYLRRLSRDALGGLMAAQVVEHLQPDYLIQLLQEAYRVLRPGSPIVLETINVASWYAFFSSYIRDITHARPIHPDTLRFFVLAAGFLDAEIRYSGALPEEEKMRASPREVREIDLRTTGVEGRAILHLADAFDANSKHLNRQLYGPHDYAVVAWKR
jgi:SAM-dependent methyltransferase